MRKRKIIVAVAFTLTSLYVVLWWTDSTNQQLCCCGSSFLYDDDGRQRHSGLWYSQSQPFHVHIYSAFYDSRQTLRSLPHLAVIGVLDQRLTEQLYRRQFQCHMFYNGVKRAQILNAQLISVGSGWTVSDGIKLIEHVIVCPLSTDRCPPQSVALSWGESSDQRTVYRVPVEHPRHNESQSDTLAVCVAASFGQLDLKQLVEWFEMQKILGVELAVLYNHSLPSAYGPLISKYSRLDGALTVELRQSHPFESDDVLLHMSPVINDCMYRFGLGFRYMAVIDLDEVLVPRHVETLPLLVESLASRRTDHVGTFVFRNAYFFYDIPIDDLTSPAYPHAELSTYLKRRRRLYASPATYSVKSIVDTGACVAMHNHYCWALTPQALGRWTMQVDVLPSDGLLHHYKRCHLDTYLQQRGHCQSLMTTTIVDDVIILKYGRRLASRLYSRCVSLNLTNSNQGTDPLT